MSALGRDSSAASGTGREQLKTTQQKMPALKMRGPNEVGSHDTNNYCPSRARYQCPPDYRQDTHTSCPLSAKCRNSGSPYVATGYVILLTMVDLSCFGRPRLD
jgi:hypothetical protein